MNFRSSCGYMKMIVNSYRVYVDPGPAGDFMLKISTTHLHDNHKVGVAMEVFEPVELLYSNCTDEIDFIDCCWPYEHDVCMVREGESALVDNGLATGDLSYREIRVNKKGFYLIQLSSYGTGGTGYSLKIETEDNIGATVPAVVDLALPDAGGAMNYGDTKFGNITFTGQTHAYTFDATEGDVVSIAAGPSWAPVGYHAWYRCGMPYGLGRTCLDTHLVLLDPNGTVVTGNNIVRFTTQSMLTPFEPRYNEWVHTLADPRFSSGSNYHVAPERLFSTGTYTVLVGSHTGRVADGSSHVTKLSPVGGYYVTIDKIGEMPTAKDFTCPEPPPEIVNAGDEKRGCANLLWGSERSLFNPTKAWRHDECELHTPTRFAGASVPSFVNHQVLKTGTYTLRVRFDQNKCRSTCVADSEAVRDLDIQGFGGIAECYNEPSKFCHVPVAPFQAKLVTTATPLSNADKMTSVDGFYKSGPELPIYDMVDGQPGWGNYKGVSATQLIRWRVPEEPQTPPTVAVPFVTYGDGGVFFDANCADVPANATCATPQGVLSPTYCHDSYRWLDKQINEEARAMEVTAEFKVQFEGAAGDVVCISATPREPSLMDDIVEWNSRVGAGVTPQIVLQNDDTFVSFAQTTLGKSSDYHGRDLSSIAAYGGYEPAVPSDSGIGMFGQTLPATATYTAVVTGFAFYETPTIKLFTCPTEKSTYDSTMTDTLEECRARLGYSKWDKCSSPDSTPVTFDAAETTLTVGGTAKTYARVHGNAAFDLTVGASTDKLYWEITVDVSDANTNTDFQVGIGSYNMKSLSNQDEFFEFNGDFRNGYEGQFPGLGSLGHVKPGDTVMFAVDLESRQFWSGTNGFWNINAQWYDQPGTRFNNYDKDGQLSLASDLRNFSLCAGHNYFDCRKPPATWVADDESTHEGYYHCCPWRDPVSVFGVDTEFWTNNYHLPDGYPTDNWIARALGNPVNDDEGSIMSNRHKQHPAYAWDDLVTESKYFTPVVIGREGQKFTINHGENGVSDFTYAIPCGFKPLSDLATDDTGYAAQNAQTSACWTVGGVCNVFDTTSTPPTCTAFVNTNPSVTDAALYSGNGDWSYYFGAAGMVPGGSLEMTWQTIKG